jgi:hypothetical protein
MDRACSIHVYIILVGELEGKGQLWRHRWEDNTKVDLIEIAENVLTS